MKEYRLTFKDAVDIWSGKRKVLVKHYITIWTLMGLACIQAPAGKWLFGFLTRKSEDDS